MLTGDRLLFMLTIFVWFSFLCLHVSKLACSAGMKNNKNLLCFSSFSFPVLCRKILYSC